MSTEQDHEFEMAYWGDCCNTFDEEQKQLVYSRFLNLKRTHYSFDVEGKTILDIGGGPVSLLLKTINLKKGKVVDPLPYPKWTVDRYTEKNIEYWQLKGEEIIETGWDEVWIYNCLQHVENPALIIDNALKAGKLLRIFEWINIPPHPGHPHELTEESLNYWLSTKGNTVTLAEGGCYGTAYYAVRTSPYAIDH